MGTTQVDVTPFSADETRRRVLEPVCPTQLVTPLRLQKVALNALLILIDLTVIGPQVLNLTRPFWQVIYQIGSVNDLFCGNLRSKQREGNTSPHRNPPKGRLPPWFPTWNFSSFFFGFLNCPALFCNRTFPNRKGSLMEKQFLPTNYAKLSL